MNPCAGDWTGTNSEYDPSHAHVGISSYSIPGEVIIEDPLPSCSLTVAFSFDNWNYVRDVRCSATPGQGKSIGTWKRNIGWWVCIDGVEAAYISASSLGLTNTRSGTAVLPFTLPARAAGRHALGVKVISVALYDRQESTDYPQCQKQTWSEWRWNDVSRSYYVDYLQGKPFCSFTASSQTGNAPLSVEFNDTSTVSKPGDPRFDITSRSWNFGDNSPNEYTKRAIHLFQKPGNYQVTLTVVNSFGSSSVSMTIQVFAGAPHPIIAATTWFPQEVGVDQPFTPIIRINNQGGPGNIFVSFNCGQNSAFITTSIAVAGYTNNINIPVGAHLPEWWLGYRPTYATFATVTLYAGPVQQPYTDAKQWQFSVLVETPPQCVVNADCPEGYECLNGICVPVGNGGAAPSWPLIVGGVAITAGVLLLLTRGKG